MKLYTEDQVENIIDQQGWHSCISNNEKDGEYCYGVHTIQIAFEEGGDYFAEFVGSEEDGYSFNFYVQCTQE